MLGIIYHDSLPDAARRELQAGGLTTPRCRGSICPLISSRGFHPSPARINTHFLVGRHMFPWDVYRNICSKHIKQFPPTKSSVFHYQNCSISLSRALLLHVTIFPARRHAKSLVKRGTYSGLQTFFSHHFFDNLTLFIRSTRTQMYALARTPPLHYI